MEGVREADRAAREERSEGVQEMANRGVRMGWTSGRRDGLTGSLDVGTVGLSKWARKASVLAIDDSVASVYVAGQFRSILHFPTNAL